MNFENEGNTASEEKRPSFPKREEKSLSGRLPEGEKPQSLISKIELSLKAGFKDISVVGEENLDEIPPDRRVIFAPTHLSDSDIPLALWAVGRKFRLAVGDASTHHKFRENTMAYLANVIGGTENFYPIKHRADTEGKERGSFHPEDFEKMKEIFDQGKAAMVSAYFHAGQGWELPEKGGYGAAYLAEISDALVVPVAINIESKKQVGMGGFQQVKTLLARPRASVKIGRPMELKKIEGIERMSELLTKRKKEKLTPEEKAEFSRLADELRSRSDDIMVELAKLLPEEKRGAWKEKFKAV